jgi:hypothetical protein
MFNKNKLGWPYFREIFRISRKEAWASGTGFGIAFLAAWVAWYCGVDAMIYTIPIVAFLIFWVFFAFKHAHRLDRGKTVEIANLEEMLTPKLKLSCSKDIGKCRVQTLISEKESNIPGHITGSTAYFSEGTDIWSEIDNKCVVWRVQVDVVDYMSINNCTGVVISIINKSKNELLGDNLKVPFSPSEDEDAFRKEIKNKIPEYLDILVITEKNKIKSPPHRGSHLTAINLDEIFDEIGEYVLTVVVAGSMPRSEEIKLKFNWTGNWQTAELSC